MKNKVINADLSDEWAKRFVRDVQAAIDRPSVVVDKTVRSDVKKIGL